MGTEYAVRRYKQTSRSRPRRDGSDMSATVGRSSGGAGAGAGSEPVRNMRHEFDVSGAWLPQPGVGGGVGLGISRL